MGGNQISGTISATLENLVNLIVLGMEGNFFTGNIRCLLEASKVAGVWFESKQLFRTDSFVHW